MLAHLDPRKENPKRVISDMIVNMTASCAVGLPTFTPPQTKLLCLDFLLFRGGAWRKIFITSKRITPSETVRVLKRGYLRRSKACMRCSGESIKAFGCGQPENRYSLRS